MTQKEKLETLTGEKFPDATPQEIEKHQLTETPFWAIGSDEKGWNLIMGKYKLNKEPLPTLDQLITWMHNEKFNIMLSIAICVSTDILTPKTTN